MKLLPKQLKTERYCYSSDKSVDQITRDLDKVFTDTQLFRQELTGKFVGKNDFLLSYKMPFDFGNGSLYSLTRLQGSIRNQSDTTILDIVVKPYMLIYPLFFGFLIFGLISMTIILTHIQDATIEAIVVSVAFTFIIPLATAFYGQAAKADLRNKFVKTLGLKEKSCL